MTKGYYTVLPGRAYVSVTGPDAADFLQGLVTQDVRLLAPGRLSYGALLTPQGRYEYDFFLSAADGGIRLETESGHAPALVKRLSLFRLRKNVGFDIAPAETIVAWGDDASSAPRDPRHAGLGVRTDRAPAGFAPVDFDAYDRMRLSLGIPDGSRDFARGEDTVADMGLEQLNGVSFTKGCYMGQELTSRMHHRGLSKKGLYAVRIEREALAPFADIVADGQLIGQMRSHNGPLGLAMLRHDSTALAAKAGLTLLP